MIQIWIINKATQNYETFRLEWNQMSLVLLPLESCPDKFRASPKLGTPESLGSLFQHLTTLRVNLSFLYPILSSTEPEY